MPLYMAFIIVSIIFCFNIFNQPPTCRNLTYVHIALLFVAWDPKSTYLSLALIGSEGSVMIESREAEVILTMMKVCVELCIVHV